MSSAAIIEIAQAKLRGIARGLAQSGLPSVAEQIREVAEELNELSEPKGKAALAEASGM